MVCYITCAIAIGFIIASFYIMITNNKTHDALKNSLDEKGKKAYDKIVSERLKLYIIGSIVGLIVALGFYFWSKKYLNSITRVCSFVIIIFIIQIMIYTLVPKSDYVLNYITTNEQSKLWLENYNTMKNKYHTGFIIGLIGYGIICYAFK